MDENDNNINNELLLEKEAANDWKWLWKWL